MFRILKRKTYILSHTLFEMYIRYYNILYYNNRTLFLCARDEWTVNLTAVHYYHNNITSTSRSVLYISPGICIWYIIAHCTRCPYNVFKNVNRIIRITIMLVITTPLSVTVKTTWRRVSRSCIAIITIYYTDYPCTHADTYT